MKDPKGSKRRYLAKVEEDRMITRYLSECSPVTTYQASPEEMARMRAARERRQQEIAIERNRILNNRTFSRV